MKTIVFISGIQLFPPESGGQLRSTNIARALCSLGYKVSIYSFTGRKHDYLSGKKSGVEYINENLNEYVNRNPILGIIQHLFYRLHLPPLWLVWLTRLYLPKVLKGNVHNSDTVLLDFPFLYPVFSHTSSSGIINTHNAEYELYDQKSFIANLVKKIELKGFERARSVLFCTKKDESKFIADYPGLPLKSHILPNALILMDFKFNKNERIQIRKKHKIMKNQKVFLFTGSRYAPNQEACEFLISWSHQNAQSLKDLNCIIMIAGSVSDITLDYEYLKVIGKVDDIKPIFWASDFGINPIKSGSGSNLKMVEFMAAQLPIITTEFGSRGLRLVNQMSCLLFDQTNLLEIIEKSTLMCEIEKNKMAKNARDNNQMNIDMMHALSSSNINW